MKKNTVKKGTKHNKVVKGINTLLLVATLLLSVTGMNVYAANKDEDKIVLKVRIVTEEIPEETEKNVESVEADSVAVVQETVEAPSFTDAPAEDILGTLSETELYYLAECVQIEANGESFEGKVAVASVLTNRVNSDKFPNSYEGVVSQKLNGVLQFSSYDSSVWGTKTINEETYEAIRVALTDGSNVGNATYFANLSKLSGGSWFFTAQENGTLEKVAEIGGHTFFITK